MEEFNGWKTYLDRKRGNTKPELHGTRSVGYDFPGIYLLVNLKNNKRYVGRSLNVRKRIRRHERNLDPHDTKTEWGWKIHYPESVWYAIRKYGWHNFDWCVLEVVRHSKARLIQRERYWILTLRTWNKRYGYNSVVPNQPRRIRRRKTTAMK